MLQDMELGSHPDLESVPEDDLASVSEADAPAPPEASASLRKSLGGERDSVNYCRNLRLMLRKQLPAGGVSISFLASRLCLPCSNQSCSVLGSFLRGSRHLLSRVCIFCPRMGRAALIPGITSSPCIVICLIAPCACCRLMLASRASPPSNLTSAERIAGGPPA